MLRVPGHLATTCDGVTRRDVLRGGALSLLGGMTLPRLLRTEEIGAEQRDVAQGDGGAKGPAARSVILLNLFGGPSHIDMFDMKPDAPTEIRGEFQPIDTSLDGLQICEHMPKVAKCMHRATLIRTVSHGYNSHNPYGVLTGFTGGVDRENYFAKTTDHPSMGSVCEYLGMGPRDMPGYVFMPAHPGYSQALRRAGPYGGYLGTQYDPVFTVCEPTFDREFDQDKSSYDPVTPYGDPTLPALDVLPELTVHRLDGRFSLLEQLDRGFCGVGASASLDRLDRFQSMALSMLTSDTARKAFDLSTEPKSVRESYGPTLYGSCLLLARRLVEAGVRFVAVNTETRGAGHWDSHKNNFGMLRDFHLPLIDTVYPALINDLEQRGLLDSTLVVVMGEMGRTPRINKNAGRDHWPQCGFSLLTGGGVTSGMVFGKTDRHASYPIENPVSAGDIVATIYHLLGVDHRITVPDLAGQPINIAHGGTPIEAVIA